MNMNDLPKETWEQTRAREIAEERKRSEAFHTLARAIAAALGDAWTYTRGNDYDENMPSFRGILKGEGVALDINTGSHRNDRKRNNRLFLEGDYGQVPGSYQRITRGDLLTRDEGAANADQMTCAIDRAPTVIARSIRSRILPWVIEYTARAKKRIDEKLASRSERDESARVLCEAFPGANYRKEVDNDPGASIPLWINGHGLNVQPGGSVSFNHALYTTADQAVRILAILSETK